LSFSIHHGSFEETLQGIETSSVKLLLTDLPYEVSNNPWDVQIDAKQAQELLYQSNRILTRDGSLFIFLNLTQISELASIAREQGFPIIRTGVWLKTTATKRAAPYPVGAIEHWIYLSRKADSSNPIKPFYADAAATKLKKFEKLLPFRKPVSLLRTIILNHTNEGDVVVDCFAGSGSTGVAALLENRKIILGDIDRSRIEVIEKNITQYEDWRTSKPLKGYLRSEYRLAPPKAIAQRKRRKLETKRARFSHDDRKKILEILYHHSFEESITGRHFHERVMRFCKMGEDLSITQLRRVSYRLISELGPIPEGKLVVPSFAFNAREQFKK